MESKRQAIDELRRIVDVEDRKLREDKLVDFLWRWDNRIEVKG